jgi:hypothetical protein
VASRWVSEHAAEIPNFGGAFVGGSAAWLSGDADLPDTSDVDVMVVTADTHAPPKMGKLLYGGVLVEVTYLSWDQLRSSEDVLASYHLAGSFRTDTILADPPVGWPGSKPRRPGTTPSGRGSVAGARTRNEGSSTGSGASTPRSRCTIR